MNSFSEKKVRKRRGARKKLSRFDKDLLLRVSRGDSSVSTLLSSMMVDPIEFNKRVDFLVSINYLVRDSLNPGVLRLGIDGYNFVASLKKEDKNENPPEVEKKVPEAGPSLLDLISVKAEKKEDSVDSGKALLIEEKERCELCRGEFKVSSNPLENRVKYGHCFCGAAYHEECFNAQLDNTGKCVRCGAKLRLNLDKNTEESLKGVKNLFE